MYNVQLFDNDKKTIFELMSDVSENNKLTYHFVLF